MKHIHKYQKKDIGSNKKYEVYKCMIPGCSHYISLKQAEGKLAICHSCNDAFVITRSTLTGSSGKPLAKPKCPDCINHKKPLVDINKFLEDKRIK